MRIFETENQAYREMREFGAPSECGELINQGSRRAVDQLLQEVGLTRQKLIGLLDRWSGSELAYHLVVLLQE